MSSGVWLACGSVSGVEVRDAFAEERTLEPAVEGIEAEVEAEVGDGSKGAVVEELLLADALMVMV